MRSVAVLQARTTSSRLPGKSLMTVGGMPMAVLAAKRAGNTGIEVIVATSEDPSDDELARVVQQHEIRCFRGSLDDARARFLGALEGLADDTFVFRLTGDNVFPDGRMLEEMREQLELEKLGYLICIGEKSGLPYGTTAELFRAGDLRSEAPTSEADREHVTPALIRRFGWSYFALYRDNGFAHLRSTVDTLADYLRVASMFRAGDDVINVPMMELVRRLAATQGAPGLAKLVVGTAQLGIPKYGIANITGQPARAVAHDILATAIAAGMAHIDTARAYGESEKVIGNVWSPVWSHRTTVITKLSPLGDLADNADSARVAGAVDSSLLSSMNALGVSKLDTVLLHRAQHLSAWNGSAWAQLKARRDSGAIGRLGVSAQSPKDLTDALADEAVAHVQLPFNLLDWRWGEAIEAIRKAKSQRTLTVHVRSALLQGLLPSTDAALWRKANVGTPEPVIGWLRDATKTVGADSVADLALGHVRRQDWVDGVVVGMETVEQAAENIALFARPLPDAAAIAEIMATRPRVGVETLDPSKWQQDT